MRYIRYASIGVFAVALILVALANRQVTTLRIIPEELSGLFAVTPVFENIPVFFILFGGVLTGLIIGFIWEWIREAQERAEMARLKRDNARLRKEVAKLKGKQEAGDDVLALLDQAS